jgi:hypothetical protein
MSTPAVDPDVTDRATFFRHGFCKNDKGRSVSHAPTEGANTVVVASHK